MGVALLQTYPVKEGLTGTQTIELLTKRVVTLGGVQQGYFLVDCDSYHCVQPMVGSAQGQTAPPKTLNILHNSEYPATTFGLLEVPVLGQPPQAAGGQGSTQSTPGYKTVSLVADNLFDLLLPKLQPVYTPKKIKIESKGPRFELGDFVVKLGSVIMQHSFKGILVEIEYRPCVVAEECWELLLEFVQGILGQTAQTAVPRTLQTRMKDIFIPLDTMHQYMDQFTSYRKAAGIR